MKQFFKDGPAAENVRPSVEAALRKYFNIQGKRHTGTQFEALINDADLNRLTERDILAVSKSNRQSQRFQQLRHSRQRAIARLLDFSWISAQMMRFFCDFRIM